MAQSAHFNDFKFLEVTINSAKLTSLLQKIFKELNEQKIEIHHLRDTMPALKKSVATSLQNTENRVQAGLQTSLEKIKQSIREHQIQSDKLFYQNKSKNLELEDKLKDSFDRIEHLKQKLKELDNYVKIYDESRLMKHNQMAAQITGVKESILNIEEHMEDADKKFDDQFELLLIKLKSILTQNNQTSKVKRKVDIFDHKNKCDKENQQEQILRKITPATAQNFARFSVRINQFQKSLQNAETFPQNEKSPFFQQQNRSEILPVPALFSQQSEKKLISLTNQLEKNKTQITSQLNTLRNKITILEERILIQNRKIEKEQNKIEEINRCLKKVSEKRSDEQMIEILGNQMKKNFIQMQDEVQKKMYKETHEREKIKILEKINMLHENIAEKADKGEIKKALLFLQSKIKQLIILFAHDQLEEKDGAIKKTPAKCLSCDKNLQLENSFLSRPVSPRANRDPRSTTRKIRKRHQLLSSRPQIKTPL